MPRRAAILLLIAIALGAITTVAVCWWRSIALFYQADYQVEGFSMASNSKLLIGREQTSIGRIDFFLRCWPDPSGQPQRDATRSVRDLPTWVILPTTASHDHARHSFACGWPMCALSGSWTITVGDQRFVRSEIDSVWVVGNQNEVTAIAFPFGIIWPGFLINTLTYAASWFVLLFAGRRATRAVISRRRLRRGQCPVCRYNLLGDFSSGCPECGWNREASTPPVSAPRTPDTRP